VDSASFPSFFFSWARFPGFLPCVEEAVLFLSFPEDDIRRLFFPFSHLTSSRLLLSTPSLPFSFHTKIRRHPNPSPFLWTALYPLSKRGSASLFSSPPVVARAFFLLPPFRFYPSFFFSLIKKMEEISSLLSPPLRRVRSVPFPLFLSPSGKVRLPFLLMIHPSSHDCSSSRRLSFLSSPPLCRSSLFLSSSFSSRTFLFWTPPLYLLEGGLPLPSPPPLSLRGIRRNISLLPDPPQSPPLSARGERKIPPFPFPSRKEKTSPSPPPLSLLRPPLSFSLDGIREGSFFFSSRNPPPPPPTVGEVGPFFF